jgi:hypothetical protein
MNPVLSFITSIIGGFFQSWQAKQDNQRAIEKAVADNKIRLAESAQTHNENWEMAALEGRDNLLRRASFIAWSAPIIWAAFDAPGASNYFKVALAALPEWYVYGYLAMTGAIWGLAELKSRGILQGGTQ